jgi:hypothetical protein
MARLDPSITFSVQVISTNVGTTPPDDEQISKWFQTFYEYLQTQESEVSINRDLTIHNRRIACTVITPRTISDIEASCWGKELLGIMGRNTDNIDFLNIREHVRITR